MSIPLEPQTSLWNSAAKTKTFSHPLPVGRLKGLMDRHDTILDFGCGYGRTCRELLESGFKKSIGVDISPAMLRRGRHSDHRLALAQFDGKLLPFPDGSIDACLMIAVLNCIPSTITQKQAIGEICRVLKPNGILFLSDYPLQQDSRNQERYRKHSAEYQDFGVFRTDEGGVFRHHRNEEIDDLLSGFDIHTRITTTVRTMNGNPAEIFQILARKNRRKPNPPGI